MIKRTKYDSRRAHKPTEGTICSFNGGSSSIVNWSLLIFHKISYNCSIEVHNHSFGTNLTIKLKATFTRMVVKGQHLPSENKKIFNNFLNPTQNARSEKSMSFLRFMALLLNVFKARKWCFNHVASKIDKNFENVQGSPFEFAQIHKKKIWQSENFSRRVVFSMSAFSLCKDLWISKTSGSKIWSVEKLFMSPEELFYINLLVHGVQKQSNRPLSFLISILLPGPVQKLFPHHLFPMLANFRSGPIFNSTSLLAPHPSSLQKFQWKASFKRMHKMKKAKSLACSMSCFGFSLCIRLKYRVFRNLRHEIPDLKIKFCRAVSSAREE